MTGPVPEQNPADQITERLDDSAAWAAAVFERCEDIVIRELAYGPELQCRAMSIYCSSLVPEHENVYAKLALQDLIPHEAGMAEEVRLEQLVRFFGQSGVSRKPAALVSQRSAAEIGILEGSVLLFFDGWNKALSYKPEGRQRRQVSEPVSEPVVMGPREGTVEDLDTNLDLLRKRIKTSRLKVESVTAGEAMRTRIVFTYLDTVVNPDILAEFRSRLEGIEQYDVQETSYVEDWIQDSGYTPFPQYRYTERTDTATAALLDGKILVLTENSPMILICPALFVDFLGTSEDYNDRTVYASMIRLLRLAAFAVALTLPSLYVALSTFHPELIPTVLLLAILNTREGIPFPAFLEAILMEISFELLREAGIRLPRPVGSAVSIVGALVIGQAAIQAQIASPILVIVVALTGIASFAIPHYEMGIAIRVMRFPLMVAAGLLGGYGLMIGFLLILLHLTKLHTLGEPYLSSLLPLKWRDLRDILVRAPLRVFLRSPRNRRLLRK